ncbi:hypothetical protein HBI26_200150 [Parastagonospora nodorum]|nr:hypothetical protein HBH95_209020 [Parastagonospora nodorum]KAH5560218.1 hypothetical protein HBI26_200150 [Parastagonospora nodorum]
MCQCVDGCGSSIATMSHFNPSTHQDFNFVVQEPSDQYSYGASALRNINGVSQPWMQRPRSAHHHMRSPATSVRSTATAPVHQRHFDNSNFPPQGNASPLNSRPDHDLLAFDMLGPPGHDNQSFSPMHRHTSNEESWNSLNLRNGGAYSNRTSFDHGDGSLRPYGQGPISVGSAAPRSDSGYNSQSVISHDTGRIELQCPQFGLIQQIDDLSTHSAPADATPMTRMPSDQKSRTSRISNRSINRGNPLKCDVCGCVSKCNSDLKKHQIKHLKVFYCDVPKCKRKGQGFGTTNDLERHKKSVHRIGLHEKSYQCAAESCKNKTKIWPRLDNFKQHIERMHRDDDMIELIKKSTFAPKPPGLVTENLSVAPIDTMIAGMEKTLSAHSDYGSALSAHSRTDQPIIQWPSKLNPADDSLSFNQFPMAMSSSTSSSDQDRQNVSHGNMQYWQQQQRGSMQRTVSSVSHGMARDVPHVQSPGEQQKQRPLNVSCAPHTKVQQNSASQQKRHALSKLSQAVHNEIKDSSNQVDLEQVLLRILAGPSEAEEVEDSSSSSHNSTKVFVSKSEAIKAAQLLSTIIKQSPGSAYSHPRKPTQGFNTNTLQCPHCTYTVARPCDLKKHMKRHEKPYGCTYPRCHKRFGAKSDWKRHENSQHFQLEAFRCSLPSPTSPTTDCAAHFFRPEQFKTHLLTSHKLATSSIDEYVRRNRIGKNCQGQFWCGFEKRIVELKEKRNAAWDERFDHIAAHFEREEKSIEDWVCVEEGRKKGVLGKERERYVFDEEEKAEVPIPPPPMETPSHVVVRKRRASEELVGTQKKARSETVLEMHHDAPDMARRDDTRYCCQCADGPYSYRVTSACINCGHTFARNTEDRCC